MSNQRCLLFFVRPALPGRQQQLHTEIPQVKAQFDLPTNQLPNNLQGHKISLKKWTY